MRVKGVLRVVHGIRNYCGIAAVVAIAVFLMSAPAHAATGVNEQIAYQGRLLDSTGAVVPDGTYNLEFKIYQDGTGCVSSGSSPCGGTLKWTETRTTTNRVTVRNGYFSVMLGEVNAFGTSVDWNQSVLWLSVNVGGTAVSPVWDGEMLPFRRIGSSAYALNAKKVGGLDTTQLVQLGQGSVQADSSNNSSVFINKTGSSGNILQLQKNGADVLTLSNSGALTLQNASDSTAAFKILNSTGAGSVSVFNVDTTNSRVYIGNPTGDTTGALAVLDTKTDNGDPTGVNGGMYYNSNSGRFRCYQNSAWMDCIGYSAAEYLRAEMRTIQSTAGEIDLDDHIKFANVDASSGSSITLDTSSSYVEGGSGASIGRFTLAAGKTYKLTANIPYFQMLAGGSIDFSWYNITAGSAIGSSGGVVTTTSTFNDTHTSPAEAIFTPGVTTIVEVRVVSIGGSTISAIGYNVAPQLLYPNAFIEVLANGSSIAQYQGATAGTAGVSGFLPGAAAGQQGSVFLGDGTWSTGVTFTNGVAAFQNTADNANAFQVLDAGANQVIAVDTLNANANSLVTNPSFETNTTGWVAKGTTPTTFARDTTQKYDGAAALKVTTQATANQGTTYAVTLADSTAYSASFYARLESTSATMATLAAGYSSDGSTDNTACTLNTSTLSQFGWTRITCDFTTPASHSGTPYFYIKQTDGVIHTFYIDAVLLQTGANTDTNYRNGKLTIQGTVSSPTTFQNTTNSTTALTVQNSSGSNIFNVDTTDANLITNPGFEVNTTGWTASASTIKRDTSQSWLGNGSLNITTNATANAGAKFTTGNVQPTQLAISSTYTISWYAKLSASTFTDIIASYDVDGAGAGAASNCTGINTQTVVTTGWTRFSCTIATTGSAPAADAYVQIIQTAGTARTFYIDGVQLEPGSTLNAYAAGSIFFNGIITSPAAFQNKDNSTNAFAIQNNSAVPLFQVDSLNTRVYIGNPTADATGAVLVLDTKNTSGDPTGVKGAMYYNSSTNTFRCFENTAWADCLSHHTIVLGSDQTNNNGSACTIADVTGLSFAVTSGTTYRFHANITYTAAATTTGSRWAVNGPTTTLLSYTAMSSLGTGAQAAANAAMTTAAAYDVAGCSASSGVTTGNTAIIEGLVIPSANGTLTVRFASEVASSAIVAKAGSTLEWW